ncbi:hypothetical protein KEJ19_05430 [Candidatus Bathyarchaeota archaeon]|nr:hypothetical protein [Candidatus Bathyarchaeota archaeon]
MKSGAVVQLGLGPKTTKRISELKRGTWGALSPERWRSWVQNDAMRHENPTGPIMINSNPMP